MMQRRKMEEKILAMVCELMICDAEQVTSGKRLREEGLKRRMGKVI